MPHSVIGRFAGMSKENLEAGFYQYLFKFLNKSSYPIDVSPYSAAHIMNSVKSDFLNLNLIPSLYCFITRAYFFLKMGQTRPLFWFIFVLFHNTRTNIVQISL